MQNIHLIVQAYVLIFGLLIGSYLNVVIHRVPRGLSTVRPRSRCPRCLAALSPWENIPILSYLLLRGRCRTCGLGIAWRYPMIEAFTGLCFLICFLRFDGFEIPAAIVFSCLMIVLGMIDFEHYLLPDVLTLPGLVLGLALQPWLSWTTSWWDAAFGALLGAGIILAVTYIWYFWKGVYGMGFGDVKMLAMIGAFLGWYNVLVVLFTASFLGSIVGIALILGGRLGMQGKLPFGVFLALSALLILLFGPELHELYLRLMIALYGAPW